MMRFILKRTIDQWDDVELISDIDKIVVKSEYINWLEKDVNKGSFSEYLSDKYPSHVVIDLDNIEDYSIKV
ncbi:hypothetical protein [Paenibacillus terrae]|uniref:Uncharacterized protein n=1 Tax=Paenibacillus terrae TaxID=159743 RepID=A0A0D7X7Z2_9BACL|nr:hypothetical protein [Paenibacillus terrae]KJD47133.1 hypothetical protein QD47_02985 [Paenibacillus terrae]